MNALTSKFNALFAEAISGFAAAVADKHGLEKDELVELWNKGSEPALQIVTKEKAAPKRAATSGVPQCEHRFTRGDRTGEQCVVRARPGEKYCGTHLKGKEKKTDKPAARGKTKAQQKAEEKEEKTAVMKKLEAPTLVASKMKDRHGETVCVVKSHGFVIVPETREVYGRWSPEKKEVLPLEAEDIDECKRHKFEYRLPAKMSSRAEREEEEEDEELEEEEDEELEEEELEEEDDEE